MSRNLAVLAIMGISMFPIIGASQSKIDVASQLTTESAGKSSKSAMKSVVRVQCPTTDRSGTGFLHKSGCVITAAHVVKGAEQALIFVLPPSGEKIEIAKCIVNEQFDLALLFPKKAINASALEISGKSTSSFSIGSQVCSWGYPAGYSGLDPLLIVGYLSGTDKIDRPSGKPEWVMVVNAAFNSGNSGGPVISIEDNKVIGVVSSKLAPIPESVTSAIEALSNTKFGLNYTQKNSDGSETIIMEGQVVAMVLKYLREQTQLVVGHAVTAEDIRAFLKAQKIEY